MKSSVFLYIKYTIVIAFVLYIKHEMGTIVCWVSGVSNLMIIKYYLLITILPALLLSFPITILTVWFMSKNHKNK